MFNISFKRIGGIWLWNVGRIGGSFHVQNRTAFAAKQHKAAQLETIRQSVIVERLAYDAINAALAA